MRGIDRAAARLFLIAREIGLFGRNAEREQIRIGQPAKPFRIDPPCHDVLCQIGQRVPQRGQFPVQHGDHFGPVRVENQVIVAIIAMNDPAFLQPGIVGGEPFDQPVHRLDLLRFGGAILLGPAANLTGEVVAGLAEISEADRHRIDRVKSGQPGDHRVVDRAAFLRMHVGQTRIPEIAARGVFHHEERRANDFRVFA